MPVKISPGTAEVCTAPDYDPDLSWLTQDYNEPSIPPEEAAKYHQQDAERLAAYHRDEWYMMGIYARVTIVVTQDGANYGTTQEIRSPGLHGIESDDGQNYLDQIANEQLDELADILAELGCDPAEIAASIEEARP